MKLTSVTPRPLGVVLALLVLLLAAACEEGPSTQRTDLHASGSLSFLADATRNGGPLLWQVAGDPYGGPPDDLAVALRALLEGALEKRPIRLTREPSEAEDPAYRLRITFNGGGLAAAAHCRGEGQGGGPQGRVEILATFCHRSRVLAGVKGWVEGTGHHGDDRFERPIRQVALDLFVKEENQR